MANLTITATDVQSSSVQASGLQRGILGEAVNAGDAVYRSATDSKWYLLDANGATKPTADSQLGLSMSTGTLDQEAVICTRDGSQIELGSAVMTEGDVIIGDGVTPGDMKPAADLASGEDLFIIGFALTTDVLELNLKVTGATKA